MLLDGKVAVITGASRGLGLVIAKEFAGRGWQVVGTGRSDRPDDFPERAAYHRFDASDARACEAFWKELREQYPDAGICLVNNAGTYTSGGFVKTQPEDYATQMSGVYFTSVYMTRAMALVVPKARIVNIISVSALTSHKDNPAYGPAKAAQMHFFQSLQQEFKSSQYQITNLYPSYIATTGPDPKAMKSEDVAAFVREQAENEASYYIKDVTIYPR